MPFYLYRGRYTPVSIRALVEKPQDQEVAVSMLVEAVGGRLHSLFFAMGQYELVTIAEVPDDSAVAAFALAIGASGIFSEGITTRLLTAKEAMDSMATARDVMEVYEPPSMLKLNLGYAA
jgi:uncharacterized protein with GYD domain